MADVNALHHRDRSSTMDPRLVRTIVAAMMFALAMRVIVAAQGNPETAKMKKAYAKCASCHGINGQGGPGNDLIPAAPSLVDDQWDHGSTDGEIFNNIKNGIGPDFNMVPFKDQLKDEEIWNLVNYLRSIAKKK
jgi:mono/diheme cytochrome c family protein